MNLLINEPPLQVLPSLAKKVGLNGAIFLQQLHFRLLISNNERDGFKWIFKTYAEWQEEFPFWSYDTVKRIVADLEKGSYIITTNKYNKLKMDKTKWYRINYSKMATSPMGQNAPSDRADCTDGRGQVAPTDEGKMHRAIPKDIKSIKNNNVEQLDVVHQIIEYLNVKASKNYKATTTATKRLINGRLGDGYTLEDFKRVIDVKVKQWLHNPDMNKYLRPDTLFNATKFEGYLNEAPIKPNIQAQSSSHVQPQQPILDFSAGEEFR
ncbi:conserved phage C-terminal domain-containing protein [Lysinibacillus sp. LZ02]|uniref:conserved phage C-terminal domain-containing protein n=1 Tax=Lysinibacillus sp. LZ02 TaxID=3420668 RepID=UPI003D366635